MEGKIQMYFPPLNKEAAFSVGELDDFTTKILMAITKAIEESISIKRSTPFSKL
jgi:hypothetical protein